MGTGKASRLLNPLHWRAGKMAAPISNSLISGYVKQNSNLLIKKDNQYDGRQRQSIETRLPKECSDRKQTVRGPSMGGGRGE